MSLCFSAIPPFKGQISVANTTHFLIHFNLVHYYTSKTSQKYHFTHYR